MKIAFYDTKPYDRTWFDPLAEQYGYHIKYYEHKLNADTAVLARGYEVVCAFVNDTVSADVIATLAKEGVRLIALRCAGYNQVDLAAAKGRIPVVRVPSYSPSAVAEHAMALLLSVNRKTYRAYIRTRDNNFSINGLIGMDLRNKIAGVIGTGQIGRLFAEMAAGFGMRVLGYDPTCNQVPGVEYVELEKLFALSDVISLHCPLTRDTRHIIGRGSIAQMKKECILINTSRGALIDTAALIDGLLAGELGGAGLDVYEEESEYFFEDKSNELIQDEELARLLSLPNVLVTSHQAFFTREAMQAIAMTTMENIHAFHTGLPLQNEVRAAAHGG